MNRVSILAELADRVIADEHCRMPVGVPEGARWTQARVSPCGQHIWFQIGWQDGTVHVTSRPRNPRHIAAEAQAMALLRRPRRKLRRR